MHERRASRILASLWSDLKRLDDELDCCGYEPDGGDRTLVHAMIEVTRRMNDEFTKENAQALREQGAPV